jgi:tRNA (mo5U34)-methyltransferase
MGTDTAAREELLARRRRNLRPQLLEVGWYHSIELPDGNVIRGLMPPEYLHHRMRLMPIPADLGGKRVLDIGAWDGWFSFECERRGAAVTALDCIEVENFLKARELMRSRADYQIMDVMEMSPVRLGYFDIVLFLGVLYHLKHPLAALEKVCELTHDLAIVESFVVADQNPVIPTMEFYETMELGEQLDNWVGPTVECLKALCRTAGFARVELLEASGDRACLACWRKWDEFRPTSAAPELVTALHAWNSGINFQTSRDEYVAAVLLTPEQYLDRFELYPEVDGFGVIPIWVDSSEPGRWRVNFKLPPGLSPGWHEVRIRVRDSHWSNPVRIAVDLPVAAAGIRTIAVCDSHTWAQGVIDLPPGEISAWVAGLPDNADIQNVKAYAGAMRHEVTYVEPIERENGRQVNVRLRGETSPGQYGLTFRFGGAQSAPAAFALVPRS